MDKSSIKFGIKNGFLHIFSANMINKIVQFGTTIVLVRVLSKTDYGNYTYALNILSMFLLLKGMGVDSGILQYCSETDDRERKLKYFRYGIKIGLVANVVIAIAIYIYTSLFELPIKASTPILRTLFLLPLVTIIFECLIVFYRADYKNKIFSTLSVINAIALFVGSIVLGNLFGIKGVVFARYFAFVISVIIGVYFFKEYFKDFKKVETPNRPDKNKFLKYSITCSLTNAISQMLFLIDTFLVGLIIKDTNVVAAYKTATLIPFNLLFIPTSIIVFVYPYFAKNYNNKKWIKEKFITLQKYLFFFNTIISLILIIFAKPFILLVFGENYMDALVPFRILMFGYIVAGSFRAPAGNILASIKKVKVNFYNAIITGIANIILDVILIYKYGSNGAAVATVLVFIITSIISNTYLFRYLKE
ncbi:flippase [Clostridium grantii]|uniref:Membrane protein involved in the export of O-antigen and teichoic acid n=1 Tax=Clostridium grantii DSM 8605 TaxID=1121316 RepID=A0A1M5UPZ9_9CLOT|nr:flippase [Clostridium grantii]SHH64918.1 Membrane protein involved in the export of O-antigen and teichoic acid [Clostridium grantii DSM 8605]